MIRAILAALALSAVPAMAASQTPAPYASDRLIVIAHRGASGERPEHTRAAYGRAIAQGADVIEPDLVMTRDGHLVVRHENEIGGTTDVADHPAFADRRRTQVIDGVAVTGWFTEDFTLAELRLLRARERLPELRPASAAFDGTEAVLTFDEVLDIAAEASARLGRTIGVAPEIKHPTHFAGLGLDMETALVATLRRRGLDGADSSVLIQCFEVGPLIRLNALIDTPLAQLVGAEGGPADRPDVAYADMITADGLRAMAAYADYVAPDARLVALPTADGLSATPLIADAHAVGLRVVVWTLRAENVFLPPHWRRGDNPADHGDMAGLAAALRVIGVDAVFTDFPGLIADR